MQLWFKVNFSDIGHPHYDQLTPVKTKYLLTSITRRCCWLNLMADQWLVFNWITGSYQVNLLKTELSCGDGIKYPGKVIYNSRNHNR